MCKTLHNGFQGATLAQLISPPHRAGEMMAKGGRADLLTVCLASDPLRAKVKKVDAAAFIYLVFFLL